jgi:hypothetical protein
LKKIVVMALAFFGLTALAFAEGGLDGFMSDLNVQARADMGGFSARLSAQFGIPEVQVRTVIGSVREPADAFLCLQLGDWAHRPVEQVIGVYKTNQGKGWGVIAKSLGIKPGSPEFHALKRGDLVFSGEPTGNRYGGHGKGSGKGKGKGHNK